MGVSINYQSYIYYTLYKYITMYKSSIVDSNLSFYLQTCNVFIGMHLFILAYELVCGSK